MRYSFIIFLTVLLGFSGLCRGQVSGNVNNAEAGGFDNVINPVVIEPVVQCTLFLKVKYEVQQIKAR